MHEDGTTKNIFFIVLYFQFKFLYLTVQISQFFIMFCLEKYSTYLYISRVGWFSYKMLSGFLHTEHCVRVRFSALLHVELPFLYSIYGQAYFLKDKIYFLSRLHYICINEKTNTYEMSLISPGTITEVKVAEVVKCLYIYEWTLIHFLILDKLMNNY